MRTDAVLAGVVAAFVLASCGPAPVQTTPPQAGAAVRIRTNPPSAKDIIDLAIASSQVDLSASPSCQNVGTEPSDRTVGRYLAGFLAELSKSEGQNWIETSAEKGRGNDNAPIWVCRMMIHHVQGDDRWSWGIRFDVRQSDGTLLPGSLTCLGGG